VDLLEKIPVLPDDALSTLGANAERLGRTGTPAQRAAATALLPAIKAELAVRRAAKLARAAQARRDASKRRGSERKAAAGAGPA
jgi:hypothetical protein